MHTPLSLIKCGCGMPLAVANKRMRAHTYASVGLLCVCPKNSWHPERRALRCRARCRAIAAQSCAKLQLGRRAGSPSLNPCARGAPRCVLAQHRYYSCCRRSNFNVLYLRHAVLHTHQSATHHCHFLNVLVLAACRFAHTTVTNNIDCDCRFKEDGAKLAETFAVTKQKLKGLVALRSFLEQETPAEEFPEQETPAEEGEVPLPEAPAEAGEVPLPATPKLREKKESKAEKRKRFAAEPTKVLEDAGKKPPVKAPRVKIKQSVVNEWPPAKAQHIEEPPAEYGISGNWAVALMRPERHPEPSSEPLPLPEEYEVGEPPSSSLPPDPLRRRLQPTPHHTALQLGF